MKKLKILVVDDSAYMRKKISEILLKDPGIEKVVTAIDGRDALVKVANEKPDVITLDIEMPEMGGIEALDYIMSDYPTPAIMLSAYSSKDSNKTFEALDRGAVDFVLKPSGQISMDMEQVEEELKAKVKLASLVDIRKFIPRVSVVKVWDKFVVNNVKPPVLKEFKKLVVIAASTGGPPALEAILSKLPADLDACVLVVQHMPAGFTNSFANRLSRVCFLSASEAKAKEILTARSILVAPGNFHMEIVSDRKGGNSRGAVHLTKGASIFGIRPAADITMECVANVYGENVIGVVLTGMGSDGTKGLAKIKSKGGKTIAQDEESCAVFGMPKVAIEKGLVDKVLPLEEIANEIVRMTGVR